MARLTFSGKGGRVTSKVKKDRTASQRPVEDVVREMRKEIQKSYQEDYRERSLAIHGLICAQCGREFDHTNRHLLTVHHKDGNHHNNLADGSNWENLCVYCHENIHSRELLGDYLEGSSADKDNTVVYRDENDTADSGIFAKKLQDALNKKKKK